MCLLMDAAKAWAQLLPVKYDLVLGKNGRITSISIVFNLDDFPHLAGMHYATDVDFGVRANEYYGDKLIPAIISGKLNPQLIENSRDWSKISGRLRMITNLQNILDSSFTIARFDKNKVRPYTNIEAEYIILSSVCEDIIFVFLDERTGSYYCKSGFERGSVNYIANQTTLTVLSKVKSVDMFSTVLYEHPNYNAENL